jgi:hypothetical protein
MQAFLFEIIQINSEQNSELNQLISAARGSKACRKKREDIGYMTLPI